MQTDKFIQDWLPRDDRLFQFYSDINKFLESHLTMDFEMEELQSKIIADPLLGYIHFSDIEIYIIDSPLFQRLRNISQLGLANLVFPSLCYSRFEHSLGVVGRLNQILNKIRENNLRYLEDDQAAKTIDKYYTSIRLAALLHDIGHCLFSHCSERIISNLPGEENYPSSAEIATIFSDHFHSFKTIPFFEIFTLSIIGSKRFLNFLKDTGKLTEFNLKPILENAGRFILGLPVKDCADTIFLAQLMSSGLDVDKIDYMTREQLYSGIKLEIDLDRILSKLHVFEIEPIELPMNLRFLKRLFPANSKYSVLGFAKGGQFAFEEFCIARLALHVKIYLHQKVRAAEAQIEKYLIYLTRLSFLKRPTNWLFLPEEIISFPRIVVAELNTQFDLFSTAANESFDPSSFHKIKTRQLFRRAFAFGPINSYSEDYHDNQKLSTDSIINYFEDFKTNFLKDQIIQEARNITKTINRIFDHVDYEECIIDMPRLINIQQGQESLYFEKPKYSAIKWTIPIDRIMIYFQENRALGYIFAPKGSCSIVTIAAEKVMYINNKKVFNQDTYISKSIFKNYTTLKKELTDLGYYNNLPQLKGTSQFLQSADASEKIKTIYENLASFKSLKDERITLNRIITFVNQFPINLQDAALSFLSHLKIYNESLLDIELRKILQKIKDKDKKLNISFLGGSTDSGGRLGYNLRNTLEEYGIPQPRAIDDNLIVNSDTLLLFDDNINSGLQLINIFGELLSEKENIPKEFRLNESHLPPLVSMEAKKKIKEIEIYFAFIVGSDKIVDKVKKQLVDYFKFDTNKLNFSINTIFSDRQKIFSGPDSEFNHTMKKDLRNYLESVGEILLKNEGKSVDKVDNCKLGYSKAEAMVLFPYNVPTMTITALWCDGQLEHNIPWLPLASRRRRSINGKYLGED